MVHFFTTLKSIGSAAACAVVLLCSQASHAISQGDVAPNITLPSLVNGESINLSDYRGKVVYLDFWASWCPPCRKSLPIFDQWQAEFGDKLAIIAVNVDEDKSDAMNFLQSTPLTNMKLMYDADQSTPEAYELRGMPSSYIIKPDGTVAVVHEGFKDGDEVVVKRHLEEVLGDL